ncbi:MAG: helix-turn-helix domain-containing protein, partial [Polyangiaceae bacterium]
DAAAKSATTDEARVGLLGDFVRVHRARRHSRSQSGRNANADEANRIVDLARQDVTIVRVADLAARVGKGTRSIERLLREHVGVSPKWIIRRFRVQEAAARLASGAAFDAAALAQELGYCDQAHFIHDFKSQVGRTPAQYARSLPKPALACAASGS